MSLLGKSSISFGAPSDSCAVSLDASIRRGWNVSFGQTVRPLTPMVRLQALLGGCRRARDALDWSEEEGGPLYACHARVHGSRSAGPRKSKRITAVKVAADAVVLSFEGGGVEVDGYTLRCEGPPVGALRAGAIDGASWIAFSDADGGLELWQRDTSGTWKCTWKKKTDPSVCSTSLVAWKAKEGCLYVVTGCVDGRVRLYHVDEVVNEDGCVLEGPRGWIRDVDALGTRIACGGDRTVVVWKVESDELYSGNRVELAAERAAPTPRIQLGGISFRIRKEAVLHGHQDWVTSVRWMPPVSVLGRECETVDHHSMQDTCLLTASMDRTISLWRPDPRGAGLWMNVESMGEVGESGGLGFFAAIPSPDGATICANGYTGAVHIWKRIRNGIDGVEESWKAAPGITGHFDGVTDLSWGSTGGKLWLLTVSADQTARVFARIATGEYKEVARPQVHGHDLRCVACVQREGRPLAYISGAEEKVLRVFVETKAFRGTLKNLCGAVVEHDELEVGVLGASVPALGLSNKAVFEGEGMGGGCDPSGYPDGPDFATAFEPTVLDHPPLEEQLQQNTLWPEVQKLYGHGNDVYCVASSQMGDLVASACRAQSSMTAAIWLWDTEEWRELGQLHAHSLTVTQLAFCPHDRYLLSVSRDRSFAIFKRRTLGGGGAPFELLTKLNGHSRIIWSGCWSPCGRMFATGSRDQTVKIWMLATEEEPASVKAVGTLPRFQNSVTALAWAPSHESNLLAVGQEDGAIELWHLSIDSESFNCHQTWQASETEAHCAAVKRLAWERAGSQMLLASCGMDHAVSIFEV